MMSDYETAKQLYREEVKFSAAPILDQALMNWANAIKFAQIGIWGGFVLNGGGLLFLPGYLVLLKVELLPASTIILTALSLFAAGLLASWLVCFFSFFGANQMAQALSFRYAAAVGNQARMYFPNWDGAPSKTTIEDNEDNDRNGVKISGQLRIAAFIAAFLSLILFIFGSALSAWAILSGIGIPIK